jgi:hypothetical protein
MMTYCEGITETKGEPFYCYSCNCADYDEKEGDLLMSQCLAGTPAPPKRKLDGHTAHKDCALCPSGEGCLQGCTSGDSPCTDFSVCSALSKEECDYSDLDVWCAPPPPPVFAGPKYSLVCAELQTAEYQNPCARTVATKLRTLAHDAKDFGLQSPSMRPFVEDTVTICSQPVCVQECMGEQLVNGTVQSFLRRMEGEDDWYPPDPDPCACSTADCDLTESAVLEEQCTRVARCSPDFDGACIAEEIAPFMESIQRVEPPLITDLCAFDHISGVS